MYRVADLFQLGETGENQTKLSVAELASDSALVIA
jgi:hypothetical protein